jgi:hypothetical protein
MQPRQHTIRRYAMLSLGFARTIGFDHSNTDDKLLFGIIPIWK